MVRVEHLPWTSALAVPPLVFLQKLRASGFDDVDVEFKGFS